MASSKVLACGVFDILHIGHLRHLEQARALGDVLVVAVTRDRFVNKGPDRPVFKHDQRAAMLRALAIVDEVILVNNSRDALEFVKPDIFVLGREYRGKVAKEDWNYCLENGVQIHYTNGPVYSSTALLHHYDLARHR